MSNPIQKRPEHTLPRPLGGPKHWPRAVASVIAILGPAAWFGTHDDAAKMGVAVAAGALAAAFLNLDRLQSFKGAGFEAQLRKTMDEANATIDELRALSEPVLLTLIEQVTYAGRWGGQSVESKLATAERIASTAKQLGIERVPMFARAMGGFYRHITWDLYSRFTRQVWTDKARKVHAALEPLKAERATVEFPTGAAIENAIKTSDESLSEAAQSRLTAYLEFLGRFGALAQATGAELEFEGEE